MPISQSIQLRVGQELRSATITTFSVSLDSAGLRDGGEELGEVIAEQEAATMENNDPTAAFARGNVRPGVIDRISVTFGNANIDTAQQADNPLLSQFAFMVEGTIDIDPNVPGEETDLVVKIKAPEAPFNLTFERSQIEDRSIQVFITTTFDLEAFLDLTDYAPLANVNQFIRIDDETNLEAAQDILENLPAAIVETSLNINDF